jgi:hypothetical protein
MRTLALAALATLAATVVSAPAFATSYGSSHGHSSYAHAPSYGHRHVYSYNHYRPTYHAPSYTAPTYYAPKYEAPKTSYETRPAYVYQKVAGYCTDVVKSHGHNSYRKTVECKAGEAPKTEKFEKAPEVPAEPPK